MVIVLIAARHACLTTKGEKLQSPDIWKIRFFPTTRPFVMSWKCLACPLTMRAAAVADQQHKRSCQGRRNIKTCLPYQKEIINFTKSGLLWENEVKINIYDCGTPREKKWDKNFLGQKGKHTALFATSVCRGNTWPIGKLSVSGMTGTRYHVGCPFSRSPTNTEIAAIYLKLEHLCTLPPPATLIKLHWCALRWAGQIRTFWRIFQAQDI